MLQLKCLICEAEKKETILYTAVLCRDLQEEMGYLGQQMVSHMEAAHREPFQEIKEVIPVFNAFQFVKNFHCVVTDTGYIEQKELMRAIVLQAAIADLDPEFLAVAFEKLLTKKRELKEETECQLKNKLM